MVIYLNIVLFEDSIIWMLYCYFQPFVHTGSLSPGLLCLVPCALPPDCLVSLAACVAFSGSDHCCAWKVTWDYSNKLILARGQGTASQRTGHGTACDHAEATPPTPSHAKPAVPCALAACACALAPIIWALWTIIWALWLSYCLTPLSYYPRLWVIVWALWALLFFVQPCHATPSHAKSPCQASCAWALFPGLYYHDIVFLALKCI